MGRARQLPGAGIAWELTADAYLHRLDYDHAAKAFDGRPRMDGCRWRDRANASWKRAADAWTLQRNAAQAAAARANVAAT